MKEKLAEMMDMIIAEDEQGASDVFHSYVTNKLSQLIESDSEDDEEEDMDSESESESDSESDDDEEEYK